MGVRFGGKCSLARLHSIIVAVNGITDDVIRMRDAFSSSGVPDERAKEKRLS